MCVWVDGRVACWGGGVLGHWSRSSSSSGRRVIEEASGGRVVGRCALAVLSSSSARSIWVGLLLCCYSVCVCVLVCVYIFVFPQPHGLINRCQRPTPREAQSFAGNLARLVSPTEQIGPDICRLIAAIYHVSKKVPRPQRKGESVVKSPGRSNWAAMHAADGERLPIGGAGRGAAACFCLSGSSRCR